MNNELSNKIESIISRARPGNAERQHIDMALDRLWANEDFQVLVAEIKHAINCNIELLKQDHYQIQTYDLYKDAVNTAFIKGEIRALESKIRLVQEAGKRLNKFRGSEQTMKGE